MSTGKSLKAEVSDVGPITRKPRAPVSRLTLKYYRDAGYICDVAETFNHFSNTRKDLFGFVDYVAVREGELLLIQATSRGNMSSRRKKMRGIEAMPLLASVPGVRVVLIGWDKPEHRWRAKEEVLVATGEPGYLCAACAKRLKGVWPKGHLATFHPGGCPECLTYQPLSSVGDYNWPEGSRKPKLSAGRD